MRMLFIRRSQVIFGVCILAVISLALYGYLRTPPDTRERATVERRTVEQIVSVSGVVRTPNAADLGFAESGVIENIFVREGDTVKKGQILATLAQAGPLADYNDALAERDARLASLNELLAGPRTEARRVTETELASARENVSRVEREENEKVANARRALYSDDLIARPVRSTVRDIPPSITGTYICTDPTLYRFEVYPSNAYSGYSYKILAGDGAKVESAVAQSATPFSDCGLFIQFDDEESYGRNEWIIDVPNTKGTRYTDNLNAYTHALKIRDNALQSAREALEKVEREAELTNASPRTEARIKAESEVRGAEARLAAKEARIANATIRAPFDGVVTNVAIAKGEIGNSTSHISVTANDAFELRIRVPEVDIARLQKDDAIRASFDANQDEIVEGTVSFISPVPKETDGVAYFDAYIALEHTPSWMRTGLNADVDVVVEYATDVLALPRRFLTKDGDRHVVVTTHNSTDTFTPVEVGLWGNDGYVEVRNLAEGVEVVAP